MVMYSMIKIKTFYLKTTFPFQGNIIFRIFLLPQLVQNFERFRAKSIIRTFKSFAGLQHRLEYVKNINNIKFINDSKATNIDSVITAINTIKEPIILLLGGQK